jgi:hypothetical protein
MSLSVNDTRTEQMKVTDLQELASRVSRVTDNINYGGCAVFASMVAPHVSIFFPGSKIRVMGRNPEIDISAVRPSDPTDVHEWNDNGVHFGHVVIEFQVKGETFYFDSDGVHTRQALENEYPFAEFHVGEMLLEDVTALASQPDGWNWMFERQFIEPMKRAMREFLSDYCLRPF